MRKKRLFVFDMDGVLVASEKSWIEDEADFYVKLFGKEIAGELGDMVGVSIEDIYQKAKALDTTVSHEEYDRKSDEAALRIYGRCPISEGVDDLVEYLVTHDWQIALLSSSPMHWIEQVTNRLPWRNQLSMVLSLNAHKELRPKPAPDGYLYLLKTLHAHPKQCVALEDSNPGIASAKSAGFFTIGFQQHLPVGYTQKGADITAETMKDVLVRIHKWTEDREDERDAVGLTCQDRGQGIPLKNIVKKNQ
ncbi:HAD family phosphatase [Candidatus Gottesmanbacteria bacterium]|nr:HAD family phosphatase [Candidatus Gottesmanbacteria bacterium]